MKVRSKQTLLEALYNFRHMDSTIKDIDNLIAELNSFKLRILPKSNFPSPPPNWQSVHIGEGVFVPTDNPELECEVVWWNA